MFDGSSAVGYERHLTPVPGRLFSCSPEGLVMVDRPVKVQVALERDLAAALRGRGAVRELVSGHATATFIDNAMVATSELVTNAVLYTDGPIELCARFDRPRGWLRVEVSDSSREPARPRAGPVRGQVGGFGLRLVAAVSSRWGSVFDERGKTVWFELVESPRAAPDAFA